MGKNAGRHRPQEGIDQLLIVKPGGNKRGAAEGETLSLWSGGEGAGLAGKTPF